MGERVMTTSKDRDWQLREQEQVIRGNEALFGRQHLLVAMTRMRNEALILPDTLDYLSGFADAIIAYDDASTDRTVEILRAHPKVALIVANREWEQDVDARKRAEARHRGLLLDMARAELPHEWMFCFDPDERVVGDVRELVQSPRSEACNAVRVRLFDAYMTSEDQEPYTPEQELMHFRRYFGPEQRDILMLGGTGQRFSSSTAGDARRKSRARSRRSSTVSTMESLCRKPIGKRHATTISATFRSRLMGRNGKSGRERRSMRSRTSSVRSMSGEKPSSPMPFPFRTRRISTGRDLVAA